MWLHWAIALLIVANWPLGFIMEKLPPASRTWMVPLHVSIGMTVLTLTAVRVYWRLTHRPPPLDPTLAWWEKGLAHAVHSLLYVFMIGMPMTGWFLMSCHPPKPGTGPLVWGLFHLPKIPYFSHLEKIPQDAAHDLWVEVHIVGGYILLGVFVLHVAGALKHQFIDRHPSLSRMGIGRPPKSITS
jgi:cytochrome b561